MARKRKGWTRGGEFVIVFSIEFTHDEAVKRCFLPGGNATARLGGFHAQDEPLPVVK